MKKERVIVIYADTWDNLCVEMLGYYHDHCRHYYAGLTTETPKHLQDLIKEEKNYVFLCEEDEPYKVNNMKNFNSS
jgi:hypothetical protein